jgi:hypothetical protein
VATIDSNYRTKEGTTQMRRRRSIQRPDQGFPLVVLEAGKHGQGHEDASMAVAVVSSTQGFLPNHAVNPNAHGHASRSLFWSHCHEKLAKDVIGGGELTIVSPS